MVNMHMKISDTAGLPSLLFVLNCFRFLIIGIAKSRELSCFVVMVYNSLNADFGGMCKHLQFGIVLASNILLELRHLFLTNV